MSMIEKAMARLPVIKGSWEGWREDSVHSRIRPDSDRVRTLCPLTDLTVFRLPQPWQKEKPLNAGMEEHELQGSTLDDWC